MFNSEYNMFLFSMVEKDCIKSKAKKRFLDRKKIDRQIGRQKLIKGLELRFYKLAWIDWIARISLHIYLFSET